MHSILHILHVLHIVRVEVPPQPLDLTCILPTQLHVHVKYMYTPAAFSRVLLSCTADLIAGAECLAGMYRSIGQRTCSGPLG